MSHHAPKQKKRRNGLFTGYSDEYQPLGAYAILAAGLNVGFIGGMVNAHRQGLIPKRVDTKDIVLLGLATHKIARVITKDGVTSFVRAPFVHLEEKSGSNSRLEEPRGRGLRHAIGELLACPECMGHWVATGLVMGQIYAPRVTRTVTAMYASLTIGDTLQFLYAGLKARA